MSVLRSLAAAPTDYGLPCLVFVIWGRPLALIVVYCLLFLGTTGYLALGLPKWFQDMKALKPPSAG